MRPRSGPVRKLDSHKLVNLGVPVRNRTLDTSVRERKVDSNSKI